MESKIKNKWLKALRSGKYKQGIDALKIDNRFCCLGVLCDIYAKEKKVAWVESRDSKGQFLGESNVLPMTVVDWAGVEKHDPRVKNVMGYTTRTLSGLNDTGVSFKKIADIIEEQL